MLPKLGIKMSNAKSLKYFKLCDTDGSGEIDIEEFKARRRRRVVAAAASSPPPPPSLSPARRRRAVSLPPSRARASL